LSIAENWPRGGMENYRNDKLY